jgi:hypothetical protein
MMLLQLIVEWHLLTDGRIIWMKNPEKVQKLMSETGRTPVQPNVSRISKP